MLTEPANKFSQAFASSGDKTIIPETQETADGSASLETGFPPETQKKISAGGIAPKRKDFNGILNMLSTYAVFAQSGGVYEWDESLEYAAMCLIQCGGEYYVCVKANSAQDPEEDDGTYWQTIADYLGLGSIGADLLYGSGTPSASLGKDGDIYINTSGTANAIYHKEDGAWVLVKAITDISGNAGTADVAEKLGTSTVGGTAQGIYLKSGTATALSADVGSGTKPVYLDEGTITASSSTVGGTTSPVYMKSGVITELGKTLGGSFYTSPEQLGLDDSATPDEILAAMASGSVFVYQASSLTADEWNLPTTYGEVVIIKSAGGIVRSAMFLLTKNSSYDFRRICDSSGYYDDETTWYYLPRASAQTVGSTSTPVYLNKGILTACSYAGTTAYKKAANGYVKLSCGVIIQWGYVSASANLTSVTFPITFPSKVTNVQITQKYNTGGSKASTTNIGYYSLTTSGMKVGAMSAERTGYLYWMAIGY